MLLAFLTLLGVIAIVAVVGFFMLRKGPEIIQGQAEVTEYRVSSKVPGRILEFRVKEGQSVNAGDTLAILEAPDVMAPAQARRAGNQHGHGQLPQGTNPSCLRDVAKSTGRCYYCREIIPKNQKPA